MKTKKRLETFTFYDHTGIEAHLTRMAQKGWLPEKIGRHIWTYRRIEPKALTFSVCYFAKASEYDPEPSEEQETFYDFCAHTGWTLAASNAQLQVFYDEREDPVPIETDPALEVEAIHRTMKRIIPNQLIMLFLSVLNIRSDTSLLVEHPINMLSDPVMLFTLMLWTLMTLFFGMELGCYYIWRHRARKAAAQGNFLPTKGRPVFQKVILAMMGVLSVCDMVCIIFTGGSQVPAWVAGFSVVLVLLMVLSVSGLRGLLKRKKVSADTNRVVTYGVCFLTTFAMLVVLVVILFSIDESDLQKMDADAGKLPLSLSDFMDVPSGKISQRRTHTRSALLGYLEAGQLLPPDGTEGSPRGLDYDVVEVKLPALYDICRDEMLCRHDTRNNRNVSEGEKMWYEPSDPAPWGAAEAYRWTDGDTPRDQFLLCYPDRIVEISFSNWEPAPAQMELVGERLGTPAS